MEDSDEFNWAVRVVIKRQLRDLLQQLHERGDEIAVLAINTDNGSYSNFGSSFGECFVSEQKSLMPNFLKYCRELKQKPGLEQSVLRTVPVPTTMTIHTPVVRQPGTQHTQPSTLSTFRAGENYALASMEKSSDSVGSSKTVLRIKIPKTIAAGTRDLPGLVGDLVSSQLSGKKKMEIQTEAKSKEIERKRAIVNSPDESVRKRTRKSAMLDTKSSEDKTKTSTPKQPESTPTKDTTDPTDVPFTRARRSTRKMTVRYIEGLESMKKKKSRGKTDESMESNEDAVPDSAEADDSMDVATVKTPSKRLTDTNQGVTKQVAATQDKDVVGETTATEVTGDGLKDIMRQVDLATVGHDLGNKEIRVELSMEEDGTKSQKVKVEICDDDDENVDGDDFDDSDDYGLDVSGEEDDPDFEPETQVATSSNVKPLWKDISPIAGKPTTVVGSERFTKAQLHQLKRKPKYRSEKDKMIVECNLCGQKITGYSNLKSHKKRVHEKVRNFECQICLKGFWSNNARESHTLSVHTRKCDDCGEYVVESVPWEDGINMKTRRDVICSCGSIVSIFSRFGRMRQYLRPDEPDMEGNVEERRKANSSTKYACGTCGKLFLKRANCERHSRMHTNIKVCVCDLCGNQYQYTGSLAKHMVSEHGIVGHVCELCGKNFKTEQSLTTHMVKYHVEHVMESENWIVVAEKEETASQHDEAVSSHQETVIDIGGKAVQVDENGIVVQVGDAADYVMKAEPGDVVGAGAIVSTTPHQHGTEPQLTIRVLDNPSEVVAENL